MARNSRLRPKETPRMTKRRMGLRMDAIYVAKTISSRIALIEKPSRSSWMIPSLRPAISLIKELPRLTQETKQLLVVGT